MEETSFKPWQEVNRDTLVHRRLALLRRLVMEAEREDNLDEVRAFYADYGRGIDGMQLPYVTHCFRAKSCDLVTSRQPIRTTTVSRGTGRERRHRHRHVAHRLPLTPAPGGTMGRTTPLTAAALLGLALLAPTTPRAPPARPAAARPPRSWGPARAHRHRGARRHRDRRACRVEALGGDDLICVAGHGPAPTCSPSTPAAGPTRSTRPPSRRATTSPRSSAPVPTRWPVAGPTTRCTPASGRSRSAVAPARAPTPRPTPSTPGRPADSVLSGSAGVDNHDAITLGLGDDYTFLGSPQVASDAVLDGGADLDTVRLTSGDADINLDMAAGHVHHVLRHGPGTLLRVPCPSSWARHARPTAAPPGNDAIDISPTSAMPTPSTSATGAGQDQIVVEPAQHLRPAAASTAASAATG